MTIFSLSLSQTNKYIGHSWPDHKQFLKMKIIYTSRKQFTLCERHVDRERWFTCLSILSFFLAVFSRLVYQRGVFPSLLILPPQVVWLLKRWGEKRAFGKRLSKNPPSSDLIQRGLAWSVINYKIIIIIIRSNGKILYMKITSQYRWFGGFPPKKEDLFLISISFTIK